MRWFAALLAVLFLGCASLQAETPEQRAYAAVGEYRLVIEGAALYCSSPTASLAACQQLVGLDRQVRPLILTLRDTLLLPESQDRDEAVLDLVRAILILTAQLDAALPEG